MNTNTMPIYVPSASEETNLMHAWHTGKMCRCGSCYCCAVYVSYPTAPESYADLQVQYRREQEQRSINSWNAYMGARLNNR